MTDDITKMPPLTIGDVTARLPVVQGGMAVRLSLSPLAAAVAEAGGVGVIAGSGLGLDELSDEIRHARKLTDGVIGVNIMVAVSAFKDLVHTALATGVDMVIAGAGFSRDVFTWCKEAGTEMVPVVSSARVAKLAERFGASAVILEGTEAGGHLGTDRRTVDILPEVLEAVDIPVIAAGGIVTGMDIARMIKAGASGVQMGSRFLATHESSAPEAFKQLYIDATEDDIVEVPSPVGLQGRAILNPFAKRLLSGERPPIIRCESCLKRCHKDYCIMDRLLLAQDGDVEEGLVFSGMSSSRIDEILPAAEVMSRLEAEYAEAVGVL